jgi:hypothetical protein
MSLHFPVSPLICGQIKGKKNVCCDWMSEAKQGGVAQPMQPATVADEAKLIVPLMRIPLKLGDTHYVLSRRWWTAYCNYLGLETDFHTSINTPELKSDDMAGKPGPIDNGELKAKDAKFDEIDTTKREHDDYEIVPGAGYELLLHWYGAAPNTPHFPRKVVPVGLAQQERVDLYPAFLTIITVT